MGKVAVFIFFGTIFESANDFINVLFAQYVLGFTFSKCWLASINKMFWYRFAFLQDQNTSRDTRSVKNIGSIPITASR
jgi:hypothetical protein